MNRIRSIDADDLLKRAGIAALNQLSPLSAVAEALTKLRGIVGRLDDLDRVFLRNATVEALTRAKVRSAARLVDATSST